MQHIEPKLDSRQNFNNKVIKEMTLASLYINYSIKRSKSTYICSSNVKDSNTQTTAEVVAQLRKMSVNAE